MDLDTSTKNKSTPLHYAALKGHQDIVEFLISNGALMDCKNDKNDTPKDSAENNWPDLFQHLKSLEKK